MAKKKKTAKKSAKKTPKRKKAASGKTGARKKVGCKKQDVHHKPNGDFAAGNRANPKGRPKGALSIKNAWERSLRRKIRGGLDKTKLDAIVDSLVDQALAQQYKDRLALMKETGDRVDGKPAQSIVQTNIDGDPWDEKSDSELDLLIAADVVDDPEPEEET